MKKGNDIMTEIQNTGSNLATSTQQRMPSSVLGKDDFLRLLVMQLRNQDPMNPLNGTEFASQLAQFSSVEQLANINTNLTQSIDGNAILAQSINNALSSTFIGKQVRATADSFNYTSGGNLQLGYTLQSAASSVSIKIYDKSGNLVRTIQGKEFSKGDHTISWDGKNEEGVSLESGQYSFKIEAKDSSGATLSASSFIYGKVMAVRFKSDGTVFVIDGAEVPLSKVLEIMEG